MIDAGSVQGGNAQNRSLLFVVNVAWFFLSHRLAIARAAQGLGLRVHLASDMESEDEVRELERNNIQFHRLKVARSGLHPLRELTTVRELHRIVAMVRPVLIHNVTAKAVVYGSTIARRLRVGGIVNAMSGFGYAYGSGPRRQLLRRALDIAYRSAFAPPNVRIIVQNSTDRREVERLCPAAHARIRLIPGSGVDLDQFAATPEPEGVPVVVLPARLLREKGIVEFAEAARILRNDGLNARFLLAGRLDPGNRGALTASELAALCATTGIEWLGESRDMPGVLRQCNLVCLPSYYREGVPKALLEAAAAQRAIVTSRMPGCEAVVRDGYNGITVPPRMVAPLVNALRALLIDPELRARMARNGRLRADAEFGIETVVERHLAVYSELLPGLSM